MLGRRSTLILGENADQGWRAGLLAGGLIVLMLALFHIVLESRPSDEPEDCRFQGPLAPYPDDGEARHATLDKLQGEGHTLSTVDSLTLVQSQESWRLGFGMSIDEDPSRWAAVLGAGWYLDWSVARRPGYMTPEHWQVVRVAPECKRPSVDRAARLARRYPGGVWIIGNEPDVIWQDNLTPEAYAAAYHDYYQAIKRADPSARLAVGGVSQATPLRLAYLDRVLRAYEERYKETMPVDIWTVHGFVLREERGSWGVEIPPGFYVAQGRLFEVEDHARLDLFEAHLRSFRLWMAENGYRDRPLVLTEFGILMPAEYGFPDDLVRQYLWDSFALLVEMRDDATGYPEDDNRLIQQWAWFSLTDPFYPAGNLVDLQARRLTPIGLAYREYVLDLED